MSCSDNNTTNYKNLFVCTSFKTAYLGKYVVLTLGKDRVNMYFYDLVMAVFFISPNLLFRQLFFRYIFQHAVIKIGKKKKILLKYENRNKTIVDKVCSIAAKVRYNVKTQNSITNS